MTNRREFLQIGVSAAAWPLVARAAQAAGIDGNAPWIPLSIMVYDTRFPESAAFAARGAALGLTTRAIEADMTQLWYHEIYHRWQHGPAAIAGLTAYGPMFCFAELARDVRMRMVFRAEHRSGHAAHAFTGPVPMLTASRAVCALPGSFGAGMADVVARCPQGRSEIATARLGVVDSAMDENALYTWLIAPAVPA
jgi:hypothetical protein